MANRREVIYSKRRKTISYADLRRLGACSSARRAVRNIFGSKAFPIDAKSIRLIMEDYPINGWAWVYWFALEVLNFDGVKKFRKSKFSGKVAASIFNNPKYRQDVYQ